MILTAADIIALYLFAFAAASLADSIHWAIARFRDPSHRDAWPPRRVVGTSDTLEGTF